MDPTENKIDNNPIPSNSQSISPIKLIIYDFDQTITTLHLYKQLNGGQTDKLSLLSDDKLIKIFGGTDRILRLNNHFNYLSLYNIEIAILSFGWVDVIKNSLIRINLGKYFQNKIIYGRDSPQVLNSLKNKGKVINNMIKKRNLNKNQVLFVDDVYTNIQNAKKICKCKTLHISSRKGMNDDNMKQIEEIIKPPIISPPKPVIVVNHNDNNNNTLSKYKIPIKSLNKLNKLSTKYDDDISDDNDNIPAYIEVDQNDKNNDNDNKEIQLPTQFSFGNDDDDK